MIEVYSIELNEEEAIRYYANKFIEDALEDCSEFNYCLYIDQNHERREFIINHKEQILDRIKKDEKVADVYIDEENEELSFNMVFWIDYCPYYYEESNIGISDENNIEGKLMTTETEIENKFLKEQNKYLKEQVDYFKSKYEESEKDNKLWKEMYMQRDEIILEKERSMLLPVVTKKKKFWKG